MVINFNVHRYKIENGEKVERWKGEKVEIVRIERGVEKSRYKSIE
jgi:hypothetical protein